MTRIEIELDDEQVAWLRLDIAADYAGRSWRLMEAIQAALPPESIRLEIELAPELFDWISSGVHHKSGMEIGPLGAGVLNAVLAAAAAKRDPEAGQ